MSGLIERRRGAEAAARDWRNRRLTVDRDRDRVVLGLVEAGFTDTDINQMTGVSRMTISQIRDPRGPLAIGERARKALRSLDMPAIRATGTGEVRLWLPEDHTPPDLDPEDPGYPEALREREATERFGRMQWAGAVLNALRAAGVIVSLPEEYVGADAVEHLAHPYERHVVLSLPETP